MPLTFDYLRSVIPGTIIKPPGLEWKDDNTVFFHYPALQTDWGEIRLLLHFLDEGRFLQFRSIDFFTLSEEQRIREKQIAVLLKNNYMKKTVKFAHDPEDGEVCLFVDYPVLDATTLSAAFFERILGTIRLAGGETLRELLTAREDYCLVQEPAGGMQYGRKDKKMLKTVLRFFYGHLVRVLPFCMLLVM